MSEALRGDWEKNNYLIELEKRQLVVEDMIDGLFSAVRTNARWPYRHAVKKRVRRPEYYATTIASGGDLKNVINENPHVGEVGLLFSEDLHKLTEVANVVGGLSISLQRPLYDHFMDRRALRVDGESISINNFIDNIWAPDYAAGMLMAMHQNIDQAETGVEK